MVQRRCLGIVLITTLLTIALVAMMMATVIQSSFGNMALSGNFYDRETAFWAAESGIQYAMTRLQENFLWCGDNNESYGSLMKGLYVSESNGNVVGLLQNRKNGTLSVFRIKFNYESDENEDTLKKKIPLNLFDGKTNLHIGCPYVSINNLQPIDPSSKDKYTPVYRANQDGYGIAKKTVNLEDGGTRKFAYYISGNKACVTVEGIAGRALTGLESPNKVSQIVDSPFSRCTKRYIEVYFEPKAASVTSQGTSPVNCGGKLNIVTADNGLLSLGMCGNYTNDSIIDIPTSDIELHGGKGINLSSSNNKVTLKTYTLNEDGSSSLDQKIKKLTLSTGIKDNSSDGYDIKFNSRTFNDVTSSGKKVKITNGNNTEFSATLEAKDSSIYHLSWDDVNRADEDESPQIEAGIYEWRRLTDASGQPGEGYQLVRYLNVTQESQAFDDDGNFILSPDEPVEVIAAPDQDPKYTNGIEFDCNNMSTIVREKLYCNGDFVLRAADGTTASYKKPNTEEVTEIPVRPVTVFSENNENGAGITSAGNISFFSEVKGEGGVVAQDCVSFQGPSDLASSKNNNSYTSIFAGNDVNIIPITAVSVEEAARGFTPGTIVGDASQLQNLTIAEQMSDNLDQNYIKSYAHLGKHNSVYLDAKGQRLLANNICKSLHIKQRSFQALENGFGLYITWNLKTKDVGKGKKKKRVIDTDNTTATYFYFSKYVGLNHEEAERLQKELLNGRKYCFTDQRIHGAIFAGRNFNAGLAAVKDKSITFPSCSIVIEGNLIVSGKNGDDSDGNINITGYDYNRLYVDPNSAALMNLFKNACQLKRIMWASW